MGGKSKPCRNAFYFFMLDYKNKNPRRFNNMQEVSELAGPVWKDLNAAERRPFEDQAKREKNKAGKDAKYTSEGIKIDYIEKQRLAKQNKEQQVKEDIGNSIQLAVEGGRIENEAFFILHVNTFCYCNSTKEYIPAEIAVSKFTLLHGVQPNQVYHAIINPGPLPLGYSFEAQKGSNDTHKLPPPLDDNEEDNLKSVAIGLVKFIKEYCGSDGKYPPLYAQEKNLNIAESVLKNIYMKLGYDYKFRVYPLEYMFFVLRNEVSGSPNQVFPAVSLSALELSKDKYDYCKDIPCAYHTNTDVPNYCSRSYVVRLAFIICDNCCGDLGIELVPGCHIPKEAAIPAAKLSSRYSSCSSLASSASVVKKPQQSMNYQLSQRTESEIDASDYYSTVGGYSTDYEQSQTETDEWKVQSGRRGNKKHDFLPSPQSNAVAEEMPSNSSAFASTSSNTLPGVRRPLSFSQGLSSQMTRLALSNKAIPLGRGRGRGIAANISKNN